MLPNVALTGLRVLLVEDEMLISLVIEDLLADQHCVVVGPYGRITRALVDTARTAKIDLAVLDVNVAGLKIYPVAEILMARGIPFVLVSGYGRNAVPKHRPDWAVCVKPFRSGDLIDMMIEQARHIKPYGVDRLADGLK